MGPTGEFMETGSDETIFSAGRVGASFATGSAGDLRAIFRLDTVFVGERKASNVAWGRDAGGLAPDHVRRAFEGSGRTIFLGAAEETIAAGCGAETFTLRCGGEILIVCRGREGFITGRGGETLTVLRGGATPTEDGPGDTLAAGCLSESFIAGCFAEFLATRGLGTNAAIGPLDFVWSAADAVSAADVLLTAPTGGSLTTRARDEVFPGIDAGSTLAIKVSSFASRFLALSEEGSAFSARR